MSAGTDDLVAWPEGFERRYLEEGYWGSRTLGGLPREWAKRDPDATAIVGGDRRLSYVDLDREIDDLAEGLLGRGIRARETVLLQLPNTIEFVVAFFALARIGAVPVLLLPAHRRAEVEHVGQLSEAVAYIVADRHEGFDNRVLADALLAALPSLRDVFVLGDAGHHVALSDVPAAASPPAADAGRPEGLALLLLSGGTTGRPKLIPRTHRDYVYNAEASAAVSGLTADDVYLAALPIGHNLPWASPGVIGTLSVGGTVVLAPAPSPDVAFGLIESEGATFTAVVPSLARLWAELAAVLPEDLSSLRQVMIGGARCDAALVDVVSSALGVRVIQSLGMAEGLLTQTRPEDPAEIVRTSQGRPISAGDEVRVRDADGAGVGAGEVGELWTRGPYTIRGYYRAPEHNRVAFDADGFYRTGDLVRVLPGGQIAVEGRIKEVVNRGGENVSETELEEELREYPSIADVAVFGIPDDDLGEIVGAALVLAATAEREPTIAELRDFLRGRGLARFKHPDRVLAVSRLPLTGVGKVDKRTLAEDASASTRGHIPRRGSQTW
ncbi:MAG: (2,3-dihydroxybenzoyl)adenylate synthase [Brachybacterium tyrofermentans]